MMAVRYSSESPTVNAAPSHLVDHLAPAQEIHVARRATRPRGRGPNVLNCFFRKSLLHLEAAAVFVSLSPLAHNAGPETQQADTGTTWTTAFLLEFLCLAPLPLPAGDARNNYSFFSFSVRRGIQWRAVGSEWP